MMLYLVIESVEYQYDEVIHACSTLELANIKLNKAKSENSMLAYSIKEIELDD